MIKCPESFLYGQISTEYYLISKGVRKVAALEEYGKVDNSIFNILIRDLEYNFPNVGLIFFHPFSKDYAFFALYDKRYKQHALELIKEWEKPNARLY